MENIMEVTAVALRPDTVDRLSTQIHESRTATRRGLESAVPVSIAGLAQHFSGEQRAEELLDTIREGDYPHADVQEVSQLVADPTSTSKLAQSGQGFLSRVFGDKLSGIVDALAGQAGISRASASTLLGLAAPLVLDAVGKEAESRHLDARGLSSFLAEQARVASGALPGPLSGAVGPIPSNGAGRRREDLRHKAAESLEDARGRGSEALDEIRQRLRGEQSGRAQYQTGVRDARPGRMLPWLLAAVILLGLITLIMAGRRAAQPTAPDDDLRNPGGPVLPDPRAPEPR